MDGQHTNELESKCSVAIIKMSKGRENVRKIKKLVQKYIFMSFEV